MAERLSVARRELERASRTEERLANAATVVVLGGLILLVLAALGVLAVASRWILIGAALVLGPVMLVRARTGRDRRRHRYSVDWLERAEKRSTGVYAFGQNDGTEYGDRTHRYTYDLDVFGPGSIFEMLNACHTVLARDRLAEHLRSAGQAGPTETEIRARQEAVRELRDASGEREALELELRSLIDVGSPSHGGLARDARAVMAWGRGPSPALPSRADARAAWVLPLFCIAGIAVWLAAGTTWVVAVVPYALNVLYARRVGDLNDLMAVFESVRRTLDARARTVEVAATFRFESELLRKVIGRLSSEHAPAAIRRLRRLADRLSQRRNAFWAVTGNVVLLADVRARHALARWHHDHGRQLTEWLSAVAELEAWCSLAAYAESVPGSCWPKVSDEGPFLDARELAHPLLPRDLVVPNSCLVRGPDAIWIVTGSNMSGKSTFLRAVGLGVVMAELGVPVPASAMRLRPMRLATSMNVEDSLREGTSRFHAEVKRLKRCLEWAQEGTTLVLLDEILAGTNSRERRLGTIAVLEQLGELCAPTLISTHDLGLADVAAGWNRETRVVHFTDRVENGRMIFDYRLREGRLPSTNALEVLRAGGIAVPAPGDQGATEDADPPID